MIDFRPFLEEAGRKFAGELTSNIRRQSDLNGQSFSPIARSTALARQRRRGLGRGLSVRLQTGATKNRVTTKRDKFKSKVSSLHVNVDRLMDGTKFLAGAFQSEAGADYVTVRVSRERYDDRVTYFDIARYNNQGSSSVNRFIRRPPLVFPNSSADVAKMKTYQATVQSFKSRAPEYAKAVYAEVIGNRKVELNL